MTGISTPFKMEDGQTLISGTQCNKCAHRWFPAVKFGCERCGSYGEDLTGKAFSAQGKLISFADILPGTEKTFTLCTIELDDGPAIRAVLDSADGLSIGDSVIGRIENEREKPIVRFYANPE
ncbi:MAG: hypothetical protein KUG75_02160 [Pseudomonadales bacterium]|nr:hypothetical protein [Pseudomonadales bacterium]